jgi:hypothetical protein
MYEFFWLAEQVNSFHFRPNALFFILIPGQEEKMNHYSESIKFNQSRQMMAASRGDGHPFFNSSVSVI